ncbi:Autoinducer prepeptide [[Clostridium] sordellii]|nr:cyclic lactone autoinducer peptide [Paeniclostridium sordellii]CEN76368.1 Autoinducer prepeptide [[Clostridium] sordellii] [Paeniclostridium sordellii]
MKKYLLKLVKYAGNIAIFTVLLSANTTCSWFIHQPEVPKAVKDLKR